MNETIRHTGILSAAKGDSPRPIRNNEKRERLKNRSLFVCSQDYLKSSSDIFLMTAEAAWYTPGKVLPGPPAVRPGMK